MTGYQGKGDCMATWDDYKKHVREKNPEIGKDMDIVYDTKMFVSDKETPQTRSQRDLAELCGIPHSSVARIESGKSTPNLNTMLKIFDQLGLTFRIGRTTVAGAK